LAITFQPRLALTTALIVGLSKDEVKDLWVKLLFMKSYIHAPMVLPTLLVETKSVWLYERLNLCHEGISKIKGLTRMDVNSLVDPAMGEKPDGSTADSYDIVTISRGLTQLSTKLAQCDKQCEVLVEIMEYLDQAGRDCVEATPKLRQDDIAEANELLLAMNTSLIRFTRSAQARTEYLSRRAAAYVQTVRIR
jgi:hypothetical protein